MHYKSKRALSLLVLVFFEAGDGLGKAQANQMMCLLPEQTACKINK